MPQRIFDRLNLLRRAGMILMFSLLNCVRRFVHIQSDHTLDLGNICRMDFEAVLLLHILLNTLIVRVLLDLAGLHFHSDLNSQWICFP
mgnify:CR=1 FL=1